MNNKTEVGKLIWIIQGLTAILVMDNNRQITQDIKVDELIDVLVGLQELEQSSDTHKKTRDIWEQMYKEFKKLTEEKEDKYNLKDILNIRSFMEELKI